MTQDMSYAEGCSTCTRKETVLLLLGGMSCKHQLSPSGRMYRLGLASLPTFCLGDLPASVSGVLSPVITVSLLISPFVAVSVCLVH